MQEVEILVGISGILSPSTRKAEVTNMAMKIKFQTNKKAQKANNRYTQRRYSSLSEDWSILSLQVIHPNSKENWKSFSEEDAFDFTMKTNINSLIYENTVRKCIPIFSLRNASVITLETRNYFRLTLWLSHCNNGFEYCSFSSHQNNSNCRKCTCTITFYTNYSLTFSSPLFS